MMPPELLMIVWTKFAGLPLAAAIVANRSASATQVRLSVESLTSAPPSIDVIVAFAATEHASSASVVSHVEMRFICRSPVRKWCSEDDVGVRQGQRVNQELRGVVSRRGLLHAAAQIRGPDRVG